MLLSSPRSRPPSLMIPRERLKLLQRLQSTPESRLQLLPPTPPKSLGSSRRGYELLKRLDASAALASLYLAQGRKMAAYGGLGGVADCLTLSSSPTIASGVIIVVVIAAFSLAGTRLRLCLCGRYARDRHPSRTTYQGCDTAGDVHYR